MKNRADIEWLLRHVPENDTIGVHNSFVDPIHDKILNAQPDELPLIIGLFGSWGSGKTTALACLAHKLIEEDKREVIYFNAWKYAGFMEIVPSLIYRILAENLDTGKESDRDKIVRVMLSLGKKYGDDLGEWMKKYIAVNPVDVIKNVVEFKKLIEQPDQTSKVLEQYYTQIDKAQDHLSEVLKESEENTIVFIDELDRCDPDEAFCVIKQLRIFFGMRGIPIIFVLCANPDPIGQAIKHQYGLDPSSGDYETKRILEKFVDSYYDMSSPVRLTDHVTWLWSSFKHDPDDVCFASQVDKTVGHPPPEEDSVKNSTMFDAITTNNKYYNNLRVLSKSLDFVLRNHRISSQLWTMWHLEILKQVDMSLRRDLARISSEIGALAALAQASLFKELASNDNIQSSTGKLKRQLELDSDKGTTAFAIYRSYFWDHGKARLRAKAAETASEDMEMIKILSAILSDYNTMDFVIQLTLMRFSLDADEVLFRPQGSSTGDNIYELVPDWDLFDGEFTHLAYLLANY